MERKNVITKKKNWLRKCGSKASVTAGFPGLVGGKLSGVACVEGRSEVLRCPLARPVLPCSHIFQVRLLGVTLYL